MKTTKRIFSLALIFIVGISSVSAQITASFIASPDTTSTCSSRFIFTNTSTGNITSVLWSFGDGNTSTLWNPVHSYSTGGAYTVILTISDTSGNTDSTIQVVTATTPGVQIGITFQTQPATCGGACNGSIVANVTGGSPPYSYLWSNGSTGTSGSVLQGACPGTYSLTVTDLNGCSSTGAASVIAGGTNMTVNTTVTNESCNGGDGVIVVYATGGTPPYSYFVNGFFTSDSVFTNLTTGYYDVIVTGIDSCSAQITAFVGGGNFLVINTASTNASCGGSDGTAMVNATGGTGSYTYAWSTGANTPTITGLPAGMYHVTVSDTSGCSNVDSVAVIDSCGLIQGYVFDDQNGNGVQDGGEQGLSGVVIRIVGGQSSTVSNQNGDYSLVAPSLGTHIVELILPAAQYYCSGTVLLQSTLSYPPSPGTHTVNITGGAPVSSGNDFGVAPPTPPCGIISGHVFDDQNNNGVQDPGEPGKQGALIRLSNGMYTQTDANGDYSVEVSFNDPVTLSLVPGTQNYYCNGNAPIFVQTYPTSPPDYSVTLTSGNPSSEDNDFGCYASPFYDVGIYTIRSFSGIHAGQQFHAWMDYKSSGTITDTCTLRLEFDPLVHFVSASRTPDVITNTYVEWIFAPGTTPSMDCLSLYFELDSSAASGTTLEWFGSYSCGGADGCPGNDEMTRYVTVATGPAKRMESFNWYNSMDVIHTGDQINSAIERKDSVFSYVITFQNTSSDTVYNLTIRDTLSPHLNIETISLPFKSNACKFHIPAENIIVWEFENILLPDSASNFLKSYGFVQYNIHMKPNLPHGTRIENKASISFNYGTPFETNNTVVIIKQPTGLEDVGDVQSLSVYPNPSTDQFTIELRQTAKSIDAKVYSLGGQKIMSRQFENEDKVELDLSGNAYGVYFLDLRIDDVIHHQKLILSH